MEALVLSNTLSHFRETFFCGFKYYFLYLYLLILCIVLCAYMYILYTYTVVGIHSSIHLCSGL